MEQVTHESKITYSISANLYPIQDLGPPRKVIKFAQTPGSIALVGLAALDQRSGLPSCYVRQANMKIPPPPDS
jgi:hypothetical protein